MSVIFQAAVQAILNLKCTCPKSKRSQFVPSDKGKQAVPCRACGAPIPPAT